MKPMKQSPDFEITRPLLAADLEKLTDVEMPTCISYKLDGIRCLKVNNKALTRSFKPIPNRFIREYLEANALNGMDGEIITYTNNVADGFNTVQSKVMNEEKDPGDYIFWVFDYAPKTNVAFQDRLAELRKLPAVDKIRVLDQHILTDREDVAKFEALAVEVGQEGVILRCPYSWYKCGRSTLNEGVLLKFKRFKDSEAIILDVCEGEKNIGEKGINELGKTKRSHKKADKAKSGTMGEFVVKDIYDNREFKIGTGIGLTKELRQEIWNNRDKYIGKIIKYKHQESGAKDNPRIPSFQGFRDERDMSE